MIEPTKSGKKRNGDARSAARVAAVQALYQMDLAGTDLNDVIEEFIQLKSPIEEGGEHETLNDPTFFTEIVRGVVRLQREIDPMIDQQLAEGWRLKRIDSILRAVLRGGVFELIDRPDVPARVIINEYVEVAHRFFSEDEPRVVNGLLDKLARKLRAKEFEGRRPASA